MGKTNNSLLSSITDIFSTAEFKERKQKKRKDKAADSKEKRGQGDILATGSDITFGTILEEDYQAIHAEEDRQNQLSKLGKIKDKFCFQAWAKLVTPPGKAVMGQTSELTQGKKGRSKKKKKKKPNRLLSTLSEIFSTGDHDDARSVQSEAPRSSSKSLMNSRLTMSGEFDLSKVVDPKEALVLERDRRIRAETQLQNILELQNGNDDQGTVGSTNSILSLNRQLLSLKLKLNREEKNRLEAERREYEAHSELEMCHTALYSAQQSKVQLEAELMEAAADVLEQQTLQAACEEIQKGLQEALKHEREAWETAERHRKNLVTTEDKLKESEEENNRLRGEIKLLQAESQQWEEALDRLQDQVDKVIQYESKKPALPNGLPKPIVYHPIAGVHAGMRPTQVFSSGSDSTAHGDEASRGSQPASPPRTPARVEYEPTAT